MGLTALFGMERGEPHCNNHLRVICNLLLFVGWFYDITAFTPVAYQRGNLPRPFKEISSCGGFRAYMLSALIPSQRSYPAMLLAEQLVHQRFVQPVLSY